MVARVAELPDGDGIIGTVAYGGADEFSGVDPQKREFAWDGTAFRQVAGPTAFPVPVQGDLSITAGPLTFGPVQDGKRHGTISVTVKNKGTSPTPLVKVSLPLRGLEIAGTPQDSVIGIVTLAPGETRVLELDVVMWAKDDGNRATINVRVHSFIRDTAPGDNQVVVAINRR